MTKTLIWDFDGTLGYWEGGKFGAALLEAISQREPPITLTPEQVQPYLKSGFPWHEPERPHTHITSAEAWWEWINPIFERALLAVDVGPSQAKELAQAVRPVFTNLDRWRLFDDVLPTLSQLAEVGWQQVIFSNHVPELPQIVEHLGLNKYIDQVFNSAELGYEKPHPQAFQMVLTSLAHSDSLCMIGDNPNADVAGAEAAGIPAILVRNYSDQARFFCESIAQVPAIIDQLATP